MQAITGDYAEIVATVATTPATHGHRPAAGDVIITDSVISPIPIQNAREFEFALDPFEPLNVRMA